MLDYFSLLFSIIFFRWKIYSFPSIFIYKIIKFLWLFADHFLFLHDLTRLLQRAENDYLFCWLLMGFIVVFLFFIQLGESLYDPPPFGFVLWHLWYNKWTKSKTDLLPFKDSKLFWYLLKLIIYFYFITPSASSLIMISM